MNRIIVVRQMEGYDKLEKALKENYDYHLGTDFYSTRNDDEKIRLDKLRAKGFDVFKRVAVKKLIATAEDSDLFWEVMEDMRIKHQR